jgi:hypothetical protein
MATKLASAAMFAIVVDSPQSIPLHVASTQSTQTNPEKTVARYCLTYCDLLVKESVAA